ncbi:MAG TPA: hypothetical protein VGF45_22580 [Polyangia bacterium]
MNIEAGQPDDDNGCAVSANACGNTGTCNGSGVCTQAPAGTACSPVCVGGDSTQQRTCDGSGTCTATGSPDSCGNYRCDSGSCRTSCNNDNQCSGNNMCVAGLCVPPIITPPPDPDAGM